MTEAVKLALITATPPTIMALGGFLLGLRNGKKQDAARQEIQVHRAVEETQSTHLNLALATSALKSDTIIEKAVEIHGLANSAMSDLLAKNAVLVAEVAELKHLVASLQNRA